MRRWLKWSFETARGTFERYSAAHGSLAAAGLTIYSLLAAVPMARVVLAVLRPFVDEASGRRAMVRLAGRFLEPGAAETARDLVGVASAESNDVWGAILAFLFAGWAATRLFTAMHEVLDALFCHEPPRDNGLRASVLASLRARGIAFALLLGAALLVLLSFLFDGALDLLEQGRLAQNAIALTGLRGLNAVVSIALTAGATVFVLRRLPSNRCGPSLRSSAIAALLLGVATTLVRTPVLAFLGRPGASSATGAVGSVIGFLVWIYLVAQLVVLCAAFAAELDARRARRRPSASTENDRLAVAAS
jgi:membrane protein